MDNLLEFMKRRAHPQSLLMSAGTIFAGTAAAVIRGNMEVLVASVCLLFAIFTQLASNFYHYYALLKRHSDSGGIQRLPSSRLRENEAELHALYEGSTGALLVSATLGLTLMTMSNNMWQSLLAGVVVYGLTWLITVYPKVYSSPWSLLITFLLFGPVGVVCTSALQYQYESGGALLKFYDYAPSLFIGPAMGLLACSHHLVMGYFQSYIAPGGEYRGMLRGKGSRVAAWSVGINGVIAFGLLVWMTLTLHFSEPLIAVVPGFIALCFNTYVALRMLGAGVGELRFLTMVTRMNIFLTGFLSFVLWWIIGLPDDSMRVIFPMG
ncbi:MAG: hypothetical protein K2F87_01780 [Muribaculaceae bacterium]|nr:hypothetical protein [Muribaculaceae bacterium]